MHPNRANFIRGLDIIFSRWVALKMAVEMEWGGHNSAEKQALFKESLVEYFDKEGKNVEVEDIEDILIEVMSTQFNTLLEDESERQVAQSIWSLFRDCVNGKTDYLASLVKKSEKPLEMPVVAPTQNDSSDEGSDYEDGDEDDMIE